MNILVTGGSGFIGTALCEKLKEEGYQYTNIDRVNGDELSDHIKDVKNYDVVIHLAAQTSVFNDDLLAIEEDNIKIFIQLVIECEKHGVKLIYCSSSTAFKPNTRSMYGLSKQFDEAFGKIYSTHSIGLRLHNVYGPNPRKGTLLYHIINDDEIVLYNNGNNYRSFTYIDDVVDCIIECINNKYLFGIYNVRNQGLASTKSFTKMALTLMGSNKNIIYENEKREFDTELQDFSEDIKTLFPSQGHYTTLENGLKKIFI